jgi:protocatechuate 3,4-dioxygenase beta subunit
MTVKYTSRAVARRRVLTGLTAGAALIATGRVASAACPAITPAQPEGPFYPVAIGEDDWDLTQVAGGSGRAEGEVIEVIGQVLDAGCKPLAGSIVEVWQANTHGLYDHPQDRPGGRVFDPNF